MTESRCVRSWPTPEDSRRVRSESKLRLSRSRCSLGAIGCGRHSAAIYPKAAMNQSCFTASLIAGTGHKQPLAWRSTKEETTLGDRRPGPRCKGNTMSIILSGSGKGCLQENCLAYDGMTPHCHEVNPPMNFSFPSVRVACHWT